MALRNGCSSLCILLLFLRFPVGCCFAYTCSWSAGETGFLQSSLSALAFCSLASLFCFRFSSLPLLRSVFLSHSNERMKEKNSLCSRVAGREGGLLLILLLRLRQGAASACSATAAEEGYGCGGGYSWASGLPWFSTGGAAGCSSSWRCCGCLSSWWCCCYGVRGRLVLREAAGSWGENLVVLGGS